MAESMDKRTSGRTTAGRGVERFGNPIPTVKGTYKRSKRTGAGAEAEESGSGMEVTIDDLSALPAPRTKAASVTSSMASVKTLLESKEIDVAATKSNIALVREINDLSRQIEEATIAIQTQTIDINTLEEELKNIDPQNQEALEHHSKAIKEARAELFTKECNKEHKEAVLKNKKDEFDMAKQLIKDEAELAKLKLQYQEEEREEEERRIRIRNERFSTDEESQGQNNEDDEPESESLSEGEKGSGEEKGVDDEEDEDEKIFGESRRRFRQFRKKCTITSKPKVKVLSKSRTSTDQLATAFTKALKMVTTTTPTNEKFMSRQSMKQELPPFDGSVEEWPIFISQYKLVSQQCGLKPAENLQRLQKALKGKARESVRALLMSEKNVREIISVLEDRFGTPKVILESLINQAKKIANIKEGNHSAFLDFVDAVRNLATTAKSMSCDPYLCNPQLLAELVQKLPSSYQMMWGAKLEEDGTSFPNLEEFSKWLKKISRVVGHIHIPSTTPTKPQEVRRGQEGRRRKEEGAWMVAEEPSSSNTQERRRDQNCSFCGMQNHKIHKCRSYLKNDVHTRWKFVREHNLCFACLNVGHSVSKCRSKKPCGVDGCSKFHHATLHPPNEEKKTEKKRVTKEESKDPKPDSSSEETSGILAFIQETHVSLQIVPVTLCGPKGQIKALAFLDSGSTMTIINQWVADLLGLEGPTKSFSYQGLHPKMQVQGSRVVSLEIIVDQDEEENVFKLSNVRTKDALPLPRQTVKKTLFEKWNHLKHLDIKCYEGKPVILIGLDNRNLIISREYIEGPPNSPSAARTALGWTLLWDKSCTPHDEIYMTYVCTNPEEDELHELVKKHFSLESIGVQAKVDKPRSKEDQRAREILNSTVQRMKDGDGWECGLLWKTDDVQMPKSSKSTAHHRLLQMERKMDKDKEFADAYQKRIQEYINKGYARKLTPTEAEVTSPKTYYIPHFMVRNAKKNNKLRFVFDAASKSSGISLNDYLLKGPDLLKPLPAILFKLRQRPIALTADIADMFHRVRVRQEDICAQRFLWRGLRRDIAPEEFVMLVLIFGASCSPVCAQEVKNQNASEFEEMYPEATKAIIDRHYMDDLADSCDTVEEAVTRCRQIQEIHQNGNFYIRNWVSNSREFLQQIPEELVAEGIKNLDIDQTVLMERVLGLFWRPEEDYFTFALNYLKAKDEVLKKIRPPTKREVLALVMSVYDPLGFLSLFTIKAKILLQQVWRMGLGWDDELSGRLLEKWDTWVTELEFIPTFKLPRCYSPIFSKASSLQLHIFVDASEQAYGGICYFRSEEENQIDVSLVMAKSRVAPLKPKSIPRMELQAAVLGTRIANFIIEEHEIKPTRRIFWSDSSTVLHWIRADGRNYMQFVATRIGEIQEATNVQDWRWVSTKENVADECTRDDKECSWGPTSRWVEGPSFLKLHEDEWPQQRVPVKKEDVDEDSEIKREYVHLIINKQQVPNIDKYSKWYHAMRVTAYIIQFAEFCLKRIDLKTLQTPLSPDDMKKAEKYWWRILQEESFPEEVSQLKKGKPISKSSRLYTLSVFLDEEGIIRVGGRLANAKCIQENTKFPVVLEPKHTFTRLLIAHFHAKAGHHGQENVVNELCQHYHIINIRAAVKNAWNNCQRCRNERVKPVVPEMGQLPLVRLQPQTRPFVVTGLDYFGPLEVTVGRRHEKRYGALFTCMSTRAVHIELTNSLSTDACLMAIRRFISRRGCPKEIWSDNGTNFVGADRELKSLLQQIDQQKMTDECTFRGILWKFNPPAAPHMGGSWERLVRSVKVALYAALNQKYPSEEVLKTLLVEAENSVNSHPLTHVPIDPDDHEALTPNHFLLGTTSNVTQWGSDEEASSCLRKQWRKSQDLANQFWRRWVKEYVPTLLRRTKWFQKSKSIAVGDIVLEANPNLQRNMWPMGRVVAVYPGKDNQVRSVDVKFASGVLKRPVSRLCVLDVQSDEKQTFSAQDEGYDAADHSSSQPGGRMLLNAPKL